MENQKGVAPKESSNDGFLGSMLICREQAFEGAPCQDLETLQGVSLAKTWKRCLSL